MQKQTKKEPIKTEPAPEPKKDNPVHHTNPKSKYGISGYQKTPNSHEKYLRIPFA